jgi:hypothetical protein
MQVSPESFKEDLPWITGILEKADFVAIDCEMSGLGLAHDRLDFLDSLQERYAKVRTSAGQFQLVQYGVCAFTWDPVSGTYIATPVNAFIFPKTSSAALGLQKSFLCQASSLEFLKTHSFDFNAWIEQGLSCNRQDLLSRSISSLMSQAFHTSVFVMKRWPDKRSPKQSPGTRSLLTIRTQSLSSLQWIRSKSGSRTRRSRQ